MEEVDALGVCPPRGSVTEFRVASLSSRRPDEPIFGEELGEPLGEFEARLEKEKRFVLLLLSVRRSEGVGSGASSAMSGDAEVEEAVLMTDERW